MSLARAFGGTEKTDVLLDSQKWLTDALAGTALQNVGKGAEVYGGAITPGSNRNIDAVFSGASGVLGGPGEDFQSALSQLLGGQSDPQGVQELYEAQLRPAQFAFEDQLRDTRARYGDTYGKTGALPYAEALANARFGGEQANVLAQLVYGDRQAGLDRQLGALNPALASQQLAGNQLQQLLGIGDVERTYEAQQNAESYQKWLDAQPYNNPWLQVAALALGTQTKGQQQMAGIVPGTLGAIGDIGSIAGAS